MNASDKFTVEEDTRYLQAAIRLAKKHQGQTGTNPSVACVIVADLPHGKTIVGSAVTAIGGRPHAEPPAIAEAGELAVGATAYVTLEPCAHHGRTPPCAQTIIDAGITRVVTAITDPDNRVNGAGHQMLEDAGIEVVKMDGGLSARRVMQGYLKSRSGLGPFVTLKMAMTEDGLIGANNNGNLRISGSISRGITHLVRARHDAILVGSNTAKIDNPSLTCRLPGLEHRSPIRIILDAKGELSGKLGCVRLTAGHQTIIVVPPDGSADWNDRYAATGNVQLQACEIHNGRIALPELMDDLAAKGVQSIMVEGGAQMAKSFLDEGLVDQIIIHVGGDAQAPEEPANAVYAPFTPNNLPTGFEVCQELHFGADRSLMLRKI